MKTVLLQGLIVSPVISGIVILAIIIGMQQEKQRSFDWKHSDYPTQAERIRSKKECQYAMRKLRGDDTIFVSKIRHDGYAPGCFMINHPSREKTSYIYNARTNAGGGQCTPMDSWAACAVRSVS